LASLWFCSAVADALHIWPPLKQRRHVFRQRWPAKRAWEQLQSAFEAEGKAEWLEVLRPFVTGSGRTAPNQQEAAQKLGVPLAMLRTWLSRLRWRYREAVRMEVASTVSDPADVDQELHYLYQILTI
jgi:hypothetical protein